MTFAGSLGGRLSSFLWANAPTDTTPSIAITSNSRISLIIFSLSPHATFCAGGRKRCADRRGQQDRCHVNLAAKSNKTGGNSHGFEFSRTLSCAKPRRRIGHIRHKSHKKHIKDQSSTPVF